jgi:hypothetical protein
MNNFEYRENLTKEEDIEIAHYLFAEKTTDREISKKPKEITIFFMYLAYWVLCPLFVFGFPIFFTGAAFFLIIPTWGEPISVIPIVGLLMPITGFCVSRLRSALKEIENGKV